MSPFFCRAQGCGRGDLRTSPPGVTHVLTGIAIEQRTCPACGSTQSYRALDETHWRITVQAPDGRSPSPWAEHALVHLHGVPEDMEQVAGWDNLWNALADLTREGEGGAWASTEVPGTKLVRPRVSDIDGFYSWKRVDFDVLAEVTRSGLWAVRPPVGT